MPPGESDGRDLIPIPMAWHCGHTILIFHTMPLPQGYTLFNLSSGGNLSFSCQFPGPSPPLIWYQAMPWLIVIVTLVGGSIIVILLW